MYLGVCECMTRSIDIFKLALNMVRALNHALINYSRIGLNLIRVSECELHTSCIII
jgi:hypothetical protein